MQIRATQTNTTPTPLDNCLQPEAELKTLPWLGETTHFCLNNNILHCLSPSLSMLLYIRTPSYPMWLHTAAMSLWEQYRVSLWVELLRGPGWFRSDGRRKLLQEIPNCQTHTQSTISLSPTSRLNLLHKPSTPLSASFSTVRLSFKLRSHSSVWSSQIFSGMIVCMHNL